jgi:hypothetical protein
VDRQALVAALRAVRGVADADVDPDEAGGLGTLRLDLEAGVDEVAVASQVSKVLREKFGLGVDSDRVEMVEVQPEGAAEAEAEPSPVATTIDLTTDPAEASLAEPAPAPAKAEAPEPKAAAPEPTAAEARAAAPEPKTETKAEPTPLGDEAWAASVEVAETQSMPLPAPRVSGRPSIAKMHLISAGFDVTATVTLAADNRTAVGEARGLASPSGVHRAVATATLRAVEQLVGDSVRVELEHLEVTTMGAEKTVVVLLTLLTRQGSEPLTGAAAVRDDVRQAVIRATLDALNRRLEMLLSEG